MKTKLRTPILEPPKQPSLYEKSCPFFKSYNPSIIGRSYLIKSNSLKIILEHVSYLHFAYDQYSRLETLSHIGLLKLTPNITNIGCGSPFLLNYSEQHLDGLDGGNSSKFDVFASFWCHHLHVLGFQAQVIRWEVNIITLISYQVQIDPSPRSLFSGRSCERDLIITSP